MCDYSLQNVRSRQAKVDDKLTTRDFGTGTCGFAAAEDATVAVFGQPDSPFGGGEGLVTPRQFSGK